MNPFIRFKQKKINGNKKFSHSILFKKVKQVFSPANMNNSAFKK